MQEFFLTDFDFSNIFNYFIFYPRPPSSRREEGSGAFKKVSNAVSAQGRPKGRPEMEPSLETFSLSELLFARSANKTIEKRKRRSRLTFISKTIYNYKKNSPLLHSFCLLLSRSSHAIIILSEGQKPRTKERKKIV